MNSLETCIEQICNFPISYISYNKSPIEILEESGFELYKKQINEKVIQSFLEGNYHLIDRWVGFSQNIRHQPAWSFGPVGDQWRTCYVSKTKREEYVFMNPYEACAKMVYETIKGICTI